MQEEAGNGCEKSASMGRIEHRPLWVLNLSILARAVHQVGAAVFLAAYLLDALPGPPLFYVVVALLSGLLLMVTEWLRHRQIYRELAGLTTLVKILLLGAAYHSFLPPQATVLLAFIIASIGAHVPKTVRHRLLF
jgi:NhaP-type Na+/H+ or K+/H+ antiporter